MFNRNAGILLPISSLPSKYGIGTFGKQAYNFIDFLCNSGQTFWQILPMGPISFGDSPYQSFSAYAGNPYYIDLQLLVEENLVNSSNLDATDFGQIKEYIDYEKLYNNRFIILKDAYCNFIENKNQEFESFKDKNKSWLVDYSLFMALKYENNNLPYYEWDYNLVNREQQIIQNSKQRLKTEIDFWMFLQYIFFKQYLNLKKYANSKGIYIIGDMPIYVAHDSVDTWVNSDVFLLDKNKTPLFVAGVPPDDFSENGQLWGNVVYDWDYLKKTNYQWWINRIEYSFKLYDVVRIDHFRGFDEFFCIPYGSQDAKNGKWMKAEGRELFSIVKQKMKDLKIIAEDLGVITQSVRDLIEYTNFTGMKVLQFAFDNDLNNPYLPFNYQVNSVCYTGTHDNDTLKGWFENLIIQDKLNVLKTLNIQDSNNINYDIIKSLYNSKSNLCIIPLQDFLCIGSKGRINTPSTMGGNWTFRIDEKHLTRKLSHRIKSMVISSDRL